MNSYQFHAAMMAHDFNYSHKNIGEEHYYHRSVPGVSFYSTSDDYVHELIRIIRQFNMLREMEKQWKNSNR